MMEDGRMVLVLDDEPSVLRGLERLLTGHGYQVRLHLTPESLFADGLPKMPACLLLDNNLNHGQSGLQVHAEVLRRGWHQQGDRRGENIGQQNGKNHPAW